MTMTRYRKKELETGGQLFDETLIEVNANIGNLGYQAFATTKGIKKLGKQNYLADSILGW